MTLRGRAIWSTMPFDVADETAIQAAFDRLDRDGIAVDILVNNAGIHFRKPMIELAGTDWRRVVDTNLIAAFLIGREAARRMIPRGGGKIINIGSGDVGGRPRNHRALHGRKGRHQDAHALHGGRMGGPQYPGQRDRAGIYRNGNESG
jgi:NAD(P)-dependent dehydrogenase (short-subunit alcohol dehydrogenase family)